MIEVINFSNEAVKAKFIPVIEDAYIEAKKLLPDIPEVIKIKFTDNGASDDTGVGGFAESAEQINIALLETFDDTEVQSDDLRGTVMHELMHVKQGFTFDQAPFTAFDAAVYEGCAVTFAEVYAHNNVTYADYSDCTNEQLQGWLDEIKKVGTAYFKDTDTWHKWAFYHPEYKQKWIIYKVGAWLVNKVLSETGKDILDFQDMKASEIIELTSS